MKDRSAVDDKIARTRRRGRILGGTVIAEA
jgi:hypothetical protein